MNNYHRHSHYSNIMTPDSSVNNEAYAKRAVELGDKILSSCEHGFQGNYFETFELAKKYGLKFVYGAEAYWVKDRFAQDKTNNHLCLFARTNKGRKAINLALAEANETGYYYKPRLDLELILNLPEEDVFITSACVGFWHYEDSDEIVLKLSSKFKNNFMLEVQYHNTPKQNELNKRIVDLSNKHGIAIIAGMDSHYIYQEQHQERLEVLLSKGISYEEEDGWYMDYPSNEDIVLRYTEQGILTKDKIFEAMENTKIFESFEDFENIDIFSQRIKLPSLYPNLSQEEKDDKLKKLLNEKWIEYRKLIPKEKWAEYIQEIKKEVDIVCQVKMSDYLLYDYEVVKRAQEKGGMITPSGRGSAVSFFINTLLGLSKIDRISAPVKLFPERFMSPSRVGSLMDIDINTGKPEILAEAQREISGQHNSYPMIAFGTFKKKSAFKMYAKAKEIDFDTANKISSQISEYEDALKYASDDEKDLIDIEDFIEDGYLDVYKGSEVYQGIISDKKPHPCAWLIYEFDIREEIGLIKVKSENSKSENMVCLLDGLSAEKFKFMKNDLLKVDSVLLFYKLQEKTGFKIPTQTELINLCDGNQKVWDIYKDGITLGVNQYEKHATTLKGMRYAPKNIQETSAHISAIRPAFKSVYSKFEKRENFSYGIPSFDKIIRDCGVDASWVLYQESLMAVLAFADFPISETYDIIKAISKKRADKIKSVKEKFETNFKKKIMSSDGLTESDAIIATDKVWQIINDSCSYSFNASHALSMAYDSILCAYYKSHYPIEFYEVLMDEYTQKGNKQKVSALKHEMKKFFNIESTGFKFRQDNRKFTGIKDKNIMQQDMTSLKSFGNNVAESLYLIKDLKATSFTELLSNIYENSIANKSQVEKLIKINYFEEFGNVSKLIKVYELFHSNNDIWKKKTAKKEALPFDEKLIEKYSQKSTDKQFSGVDYVAIISEIEKSIPFSNDSIKDLISYQIEYLGNPELTHGTDKRRTVVTEYKETEWNKRLSLYCLATGETKEFKLKKKFYRQDIRVGDILYIKDFSEDYKLTPHKDENGEIIRNKKGSPASYDKTDEMELLLLNYIIEEDIC